MLLAPKIRFVKPLCNASVARFAVLLFFLYRLEYERRLMKLRITVHVVDKELDEKLALIRSLKGKA